MYNVDKDTLDMVVKLLIQSKTDTGSDVQKDLVLAQRGLNFIVDGL